VSEVDEGGDFDDIDGDDDGTKSESGVYRLGPYCVHHVLDHAMELGRWTLCATLLCNLQFIHLVTELGLLHPLLRWYSSCERALQRKAVTLNQPILGMAAVKVSAGNFLVAPVLIYGGIVFTASSDFACWRALVGGSMQRWFTNMRGHIRRNLLFADWLRLCNHGGVDKMCCRITYDR
jgi:hypothetical protein